MTLLAFAFKVIKVPWNFVHFLLFSFSTGRASHREVEPEVPEVPDLQKQLRKTDDELRRARQHSTDLEERYRKERKALDEAQSKLDQSIAILHTREQDLQRAKEIITRREQTISQLQSQTAAIETMLAQNNALLDTRTRELEVAQVFLTKQESFTEKEIIDQIEGLNYEIFQVAIVLSDEWESEEECETDGKLQDRDTTKTVRNVNEDEQAHAVLEEIRSWSTPRIAEITQLASQIEDPLALQVVFQAYLTHIVASFMSQWQFADHGLNQAMDRIFSALENEEPPAISGRWRALTHQYTQKVFHQEQTPDSLADFLAETLTSCVLCAGRDRDRARIKHAILQKAGDGLREVATFVFRLNKAIGEGITTSMLLPMVVMGGEMFDVRNMEDGYTEAKESGPVMCTTSMGLMRDLKRDDGKRNRAVLLKPKVALESVLAMLAEN
ncbi:hypothetical protein HETIRDRAFT_434550 [Heterobasidion irregulare TC 32-1]|uniref:Uncharacterized protein n=1 Tax=Heterobasidion irregulare (strain TC 32-1) TaxID=747525 RepID=W4K5W6_HETIT|nr:uncharacterized protein HETIRDRAFT_434550 [Heterobasidion irregulare TC 32-1]ETW80441.1 hypothetical protein HETIRDRAFT_434550 [Heterobasidion irregulare TC 32-1]